MGDVKSRRAKGRTKREKNAAAFALVKEFYRASFDDSEDEAADA